MIEEISTSGDGKVGIEEFKLMIPKLESWGVRTNDVNASFNELDGNGSRHILFDEFLAWAIKKNLDLPDDGYYYKYK